MIRRSAHHHKVLIGTLFSVLVLASTFAPSGAADTAPAIPLEVHSGHLFVHVNVNGTRLKMGLDTGSSETLIDVSVAKHIHAPILGAGPSLRTLDPSASALRTFDTRPLLFAVGGTMKRTLKTRLADISRVFFQNKGAMDGVLGANFFAHHRTQIDFVRSELRVVSDAAASSFCEGAPYSTQALSMGNDEAPSPVLVISINGTKTLGQFDTGEAESIVTGIAAFDLLQFPRDASTTPGRKQVLRSLTLGQIEIPHSTIGFSNEPPPAPPDVMVRVGNAALAGHTIQLDYILGRICIR